MKCRESQSYLEFNGLYSLYGDGRSVQEVCHIFSPVGLIRTSLANHHNLGGGVLGVSDDSRWFVGWPSDLVG